MPRRKWIDVDLDGLRRILERRGKEFAIYELVQNAWDENARSGRAPESTNRVTRRVRRAVGRADHEKD